VLNAKIDPRYDVDKIVSSSAKQDESSLLPATGKFLSGSVLMGATLTLDSSITPGSKQEQSVAFMSLDTRKVPQPIRIGIWHWEPTT